MFIKNAKKPHYTQIYIAYKYSIASGMAARKHNYTTPDLFGQLSFQGLLSSTWINTNISMDK